MSAYQNFYPQMQMPMYSQQMPNPYMQRMENLQQFQQAINPPVMQQPQIQTPNMSFSTLGKMVESIDIVKATDIPMDGNVYYFPKADGTEIYSKQWLQNGQTRILTFKPSLDDNPNTLSQNEEKFDFGAFNEFTDAFKEQLNALTDKIDKIEKYLKPTSKKKEVDE